MEKRQLCGPGKAWPSSKGEWFSQKTESKSGLKTKDRHTWSLNKTRTASHWHWENPAVREQGDPWESGWPQMSCILQTTRPVGGSGRIAWLSLPLGWSSNLIILLVQTLKKYNDLLDCFISPWSSTLLLLVTLSFCHTVASLPVTECPHCPSHHIKCPCCPFITQNVHIACTWLVFKRDSLFPSFRWSKGVCVEHWPELNLKSSACPTLPRPRRHRRNDRLWAQENPVHCRKKAGCASTGDTHPWITGKPSQSMYEGRQVGSDAL